jgi:hypothetical protein
MVTQSPGIHVGLNAVILAVTDGAAKVLAVSDAGGVPTLPAGLFDPARDRTLNLGLRRWLAEQTGLEVGYVEQLYTFGNQYRDARELAEGGRFLSIGYLGLTTQQPLTTHLSAHWDDLYAYLPWEDWRSGRPTVIDRLILPALNAWCAAAGDKAEKAQRTTRVAMTFGNQNGGFDHEKALQRYELMYGVGLLPESHRDAALLGGRAGEVFQRSLTDLTEVEHTAQRIGGVMMAMDHRRILASALERVRGKIKYRPLVFELMPAQFTLFQLQRAVEALAGLPLHKQNFRRLIQTEGLVEETGEVETAARGRPAALYRFRPQVLAERPAPGVGLPKTSGI